MRERLSRFLTQAARRLRPVEPVHLESDQAAAIRVAASVLANSEVRDSIERRAYVERCHELAEAQQMSGAGPWLPQVAREAVAAGKAVTVRESNPLLSQGAYGDIELALQNVEWRREINLSWLEFSRWGIQQIILISRLYYIKNPIVRRLIDIAATYVFGRGFDVTSPDQDANEVLKEFFDRNKKVLGQNALVGLEKQKYYDGNLFFCFFADKLNEGTVSVRMIEATEIQDIITDPDDSETHWYYRRNWANRVFDEANGTIRTEDRNRWYPALGYEPTTKPPTIGGYEVDWDHPVLHRKCGHVSHWLFGCPIIYPALDWARASRKFLEACATVKQSLAQIAMVLTTKGGQQALLGAKSQLQTTVGPNTSLWDTNPTATNASVFASGPGTTLEAFKTAGAGGDPEEVRRFLLMCCMVVGVPETFLADVSTGNLATATTLDRPTELCFQEKQEAWREDLITISKYVLNVSKDASGGQLREALEKRKAEIKKVAVLERRRRIGADGRMHYCEASEPPGSDIEVLVTFPAIREGDVPQMVNSIVAAMTLNNKSGQVVGIDEREGVGLLLRTLGLENSEDILEEMYPEGEYDQDRTEEEPSPVAAVVPGAPVAAPVASEPVEPSAKAAEALSGLLASLARLGRRVA